MRVIWVSVAILVSLVQAQAKEAPFGQETVEVRSWRNPPRPDARPAHRHSQGGRGHDHKHGPHDHRKSGHYHKHGGDAHSHGPGEHNHQHGHGHVHGVETEHLFGFTKGSDIDPPPGRHFIADLTGNFVKSTGSYAALSQHFEYAFTPVRNFHVGLGASFARHSISGVEGLEDRRSAAFEGFSFELRQRFLDRATAPFGLTLTVEPHWARIDEVDGARANKYAVVSTTDGTPFSDFGRGPTPRVFKRSSAGNGSILSDEEGAADGICCAMKKAATIPSRSSFSLTCPGRRNFPGR